MPSLSFSTALTCLVQMRVDVWSSRGQCRHCQDLAAAACCAVLAASVRSIMQTPIRKFRCPSISCLHERQNFVLAQLGSVPLRHLQGSSVLPYPLGGGMTVSGGRKQCKSTIDVPWVVTLTVASCCNISATPNWPSLATISLARDASIHILEGVLQPRQAWRHGHRYR